MEWIVVRNWDKFQHYGSRSPIWIKNYTELLHDPAYLGLTGPQRGLLHGLWLQYAMSQGCVPLRVDFVNTSLNLKIKMSSIRALRDAGFIEFSASKPLALRARSREREKEKEKKALPIVPSGEDQNGTFDFSSMLRSVDEGIRDRR